MVHETAPPAPELQRPEGAMQLGHMLATGTRLREYEVTGLVGEGGFGIVYLAWDHSLQRRVAVKEYMPASLVSRVNGSSAIVVKSERHLDTFKTGLRSFVNEAKLLARFDHPALVKVYRFWEENGTAYMVMPYYEGPTLKRALAELGHAPSEAELRAWLEPLLEALSVMHAAHCYHRDIAPDNILLTPGGPLLLDFGAARRVIGDMTHALTVVLKPGYAPIEQYGDVATMAQGAWTDLYAVACVVYYAITGRTPISSVERMMDDSMQPISRVAEGRYSPAFLHAIDAALSVRPQDRPQNERAFRALLDADLPRSPGGRTGATSAGRLQHEPIEPTVSHGYSTLPATLVPELPTQIIARSQAVEAKAGFVTAHGPAPPPAATSAATGPARALIAVIAGVLLLGLAFAAVFFWVQTREARNAVPARAGPASAATLPPAATAPTPAAIAPPAAMPAPEASVLASPPVQTPAQTPASPASEPLRPTTTPESGSPPTATGGAAPTAAREPAALTQAPAAARPRREPPARREPVEARPATEARPPAPTPYARPIDGRCSDILQKASLEPLTAEEAAYLKRECR